MDDILRAEYLLRTDYGVDSLDESKRETNAHLAQWVFQTREEIEDCQFEEDLLAMQVELETQYADIIKKLGFLFSEDQGYLSVKAELETTRYY